MACNGDNRAQYATLTWDGQRWTVEHHTVAYDLARVRTAFIDLGFLEEAGPLARAQLEGIYRADRTLGDLVRYARDLARDEGLGEIRFVPDDTWLRAMDSFDWG